MTTTTSGRVIITAPGIAGGLMFACATSPRPAPQAPSAPAALQEQRALATPTANPPTATAVPGFTPEVTQGNSAGVPRPAAPGARSVVVMYTPVPDTAEVKSGFVPVSVGDTSVAPDELHVTSGTIVECRYDGGGGEIESIRKVIALDKACNSGDLNPGTRFSFTFTRPSEFAYVRSDHAVHITGKLVVR